MQPQVLVQQQKPLQPLVTLLYENWRGETAFRNVKLLYQWYGSTEFHPKPTLLLKGIDLERNVERDFAVDNILGWKGLDTESVIVDIGARLQPVNNLLFFVQAQVSLTSNAN